MKDYEAEHYAALKGKFKHYCIEWDGLAIDEGDPEFRCCSCEWSDLTVQEQIELDDIRRKLRHD